MQSDSRKVVVLGTGGTIAGAALRADQNVAYRVGQFGIDALLAAVPALAASAFEAEQVVQIDSKDADVDFWLLLLARVAHHLDRPEVAGVVVTHGTDTLEETAYLLQRIFAPAKPVVLTAAMRPATALGADGPSNLLDAVRVARTAGACGVTVALAGRVHSALDVRKVHPYRLDAFGSGDAGPLADIEEGVLRRHRAWPETGRGFGLDRLPVKAADWPWVEIVTSHAGARGAGVQALIDAGVDGLIVAATGNGSVHQALEAALASAQAAGVAVLRCSRWLGGAVIEPSGDAGLPSAGALTPVQGRIELMLQIIARRAEAGPT